MRAYSAPTARTSWSVHLGFTLALLSVLTLLFAAVGYRTHMLTLRQAFTLLRWGAYGGGAAAAVSALGLVVVLLRPRGYRAGVLMATLGMVIGALTIGVPARMLRMARGVPPIHDITTDTQDPPVFVAVLPLRANAPNKVEYGGESVAARQRQGYPDLAPVTLSAPPAQAFERALAAVRAMGWDLVASDASVGRIEATDTTFWFGFKDDIVVRVRPEGRGSRIDVRSLSRVGGGDAGTNARRIRAYREKLTASDRG